jgi:hypothetical protein
MCCPSKVLSKKALVIEIQGKERNIVLLSTHLLGRR